jgi:hypothetical protein
MLNKAPVLAISVADGAVSYKKGAAEAAPFRIDRICLSPSG